MTKPFSNIYFLILIIISQHFLSVHYFFLSV